MNIGNMVNKINLLHLRAECKFNVWRRPLRFENFQGKNPKMHKENEGNRTACVEMHANANGCIPQNPWEC